MKNLKYVAVLCLMMISAASAKEAEWRAYGFHPNAPINEAIATMKTVCAASPTARRQPGTTIDIHSCKMFDQASLEVWSICGELIHLSIRKTLPDGKEAMRSVFRDCGPPLALQNINERSVALVCTQAGGSVEIGFAESSERVILTRSYSGDIGSANKACRD
ncbi:hypothetical protein AB8A31_19275 [Tardiphaga sp. 804_B3_N1_9]|uniref:hypothetical protein n=1 Tax=Tardiphaga TaxID=1395974 RepID=UPI001585EDCC|nr:hypothetical protein [Tardiphaga robiniae]NUU44883.1 hypothetical protein [Tardiphaga robiniae]